MLKVCANLFLVLGSIIMPSSTNAEDQKLSSFVSQVDASSESLPHWVNEAFRAPTLQGLEINGLINRSTVRDVTKLLRKSKAGGRTPILLILNSGGGQFSAAIDMVQLISSHGQVVTFVPAQADCLSACGLVFLAGNLDGKPARLMTPSSNIGLHAPFIGERQGRGSISSIGDVVSNDAELGLSFDRDYLLWQLNISRNLFDEFMAIGPSDFLEIGKSISSTQITNYQEQ